MTDLDLLAFARWQRGRRAIALTSQFRAASRSTGTARNRAPRTLWPTRRSSCRVVVGFDQPHLGPPHHDRDDLRRSDRRHRAEQPVRPGRRALPYSTREPGHAGDLGARQRRGHARRIRRGRSATGERYVGGAPEQTVAERRLLDKETFRVCWPSRVARAGCPTTCRYRPSGWRGTAIRTAGRRLEPIVAACSNAWREISCAATTIRGCSTEPNVRDIGGGELLSRSDGHVAGRGTRPARRFPVVSPTMNELARKVERAHGARRVRCQRDDQTGARLTVRVTNAATIPITGLCTPSARVSAAANITHLELAAGQWVTLSLTNCSQGGGGPAAGQGTTGHLTTDAPPAAPGSGIGLQRLEWPDRRRYGTLVLVVLALATGATRRRPFSTVKRVESHPHVSTPQNSRLESRRPRL